MHHVPLIKTRSLSHLPHFCRPKKNSTSYPLESSLAPQPYIQPLRDFYPLFLLPSSSFSSHCYHYCLGSYIYVCLFVCLNNQTLNKPTHCCQLTSSNTTSILPSLYLQGWGCSPLLQNGIPVPSWSHLRRLFHSYFSLFLKREALLKPAWCTHYSLTTKPLWVKCLLCVKYIHSFNTFTEYLLCQIKYWCWKCNGEQDKTSPCPQKPNRPVGQRGKALRHHGPSPGCFQSSSKTSHESRHPWGLNSVTHTASREGVQ